MLDQLLHLSIVRRRISGQRPVCTVCSPPPSSAPRCKNASHRQHRLRQHRGWSPRAASPGPTSQCQPVPFCRHCMARIAARVLSRRQLDRQSRRTARTTAPGRHSTTQKPGVPSTSSCTTANRYRMRFPYGLPQPSQLVCAEQTERHGLEQQGTQQGVCSTNHSCFPHARQDGGAAAWIPRRYNAATATPAAQFQTNHAGTSQKRSCTSRHSSACSVKKGNRQCVPVLPSAPPQAVPAARANCPAATIPTKPVKPAVGVNIVRKIAGSGDIFWHSLRSLLLLFPCAA